MGIDAEKGLCMTPFGVRPERESHTVVETIKKSKYKGAREK
jgi:hypothetical protein